MQPPVTASRVTAYYSTVTELGQAQMARCQVLGPTPNTQHLTPPNLYPSTQTSYSLFALSCPITRTLRDSGDTRARSLTACPTTQSTPPLSATIGIRSLSPRGTLRSMKRSDSFFVPPMPSG